jgi:hypothetical protein
MTATDEDAVVYAGATGCYCLCHVAHPNVPGVCAALSAITTRPVNGHPVQMCGPCAAAHDARNAPPPPPPPAEAEEAGLAGQLGERAGAMPAEEAGLLRECIAAIGGAWSGGPGDPAEALRVIEVNAASARRLLRPRRARGQSAGSSSAGGAAGGPESAGAVLLLMPR